VRAWIGSLVIALIAALAMASPAPAAGTANATVAWYSQAVVQFTLTPNYSAGYGTIKAVFGTQPTPAPGTGACLNGCAIDFGTVTAGNDYLYKYAAHLHVITNDINGFNVYGEGAADFFNQTDSSSVSLNQALFYLPSTSGGTDNNTGFSSSTPFFKTAGTVSGNSFSTTPTIAYTTYPAPVAATTSNATTDLYYDYQLKVPGYATGGSYYVWVVYTVVAK
jgi:hypothetical protein